MNNIPEKIFPDEEWKCIKIDGVSTTYMVSSYGRFFNLKNKKYIKTSLTSQGYRRVFISYNNKSKYFLAHVLVAKTFIPNLKNKPEINHKDGNKENNKISNLEWVTHKENMRHAFDTGLCVYETHEKYSNEQIHLICKLLEMNYGSFKTIAKSTGTSRQSVSRIFHNETNINISKNYDFSNYHVHSTDILYGDENKRTKYSDESIKNVCELIDSEKYSLRDIASITSVDYQTVRNVYYGTCRKNIARNYNFYKSDKNILHENEIILVHRICELLDEGYNTKEVSELLSISRSKVRNILSGNSWTKISKQYSFMKNKKK